MGQLGYEMFSFQGGRDNRNFFTTDTFDYYNDMSRTDIAFASAGAVFGVEKAVNTIPSLNVDEALRRLLVGAKIYTPLDIVSASKLWDNFGASRSASLEIAILAKFCLRFLSF